MAILLQSAMTFPFAAAHSPPFYFNVPVTEYFDHQTEYKNKELKQNGKKRADVTKCVLFVCYQIYLKLSVSFLNILFLSPYRKSER